MEIGTIAGFVLTLMIFSYLLGDNFLYRLAVYVLVGISAAYITIITFEGALLPLLNGDRGEIWVLMIALVLGLLLLLKGVQRLAWFSNLVIGFIIAVGAAVAIVGAISGTLLPLSINTSREVDQGLLEGVIMFIGVATSLLYFQYLARRSPDNVIRRGRFNQVIAVIGQGFIVTTLGALYGAAILTSLTIISERLAYLAAFGG